MTITVTHAKTVNIADDPKAAAAGEVLPSDWNAAHVITGSTGRDILTSDRNYYVSTTGSDSNGGTNSSTDAWATLQHAMDFVSSNIDGAGFNVFINIGTGSFTGVGAKICLGISNLLWYGAGVGSTFINSGTNDGTFNIGECFGFNVINITQFWFDALTFKTTTDLNATIVISGINSVLFQNLGTRSTNIGFDLTNALIGNDLIATFGAGSVITESAGTVAVTAGGSSSVFDIFDISELSFYVWAATWTVTGTLNMQSGQIALIRNGGFLLINNFGSPTGASITAPGLTSFIPYQVITAGSILSNAGTGKLGSFFPGSGGIVDGSSVFDGFLGVVTGSGVPSTSQFPDKGVGALYKDTSGGGVYSVYNDNGTIKSVALTT